MSIELKQLIEGLTRNTLSRRDFIKRASALGLSMGAIGSILAACGGGAATPAATETGTTAATATATTTAAATETATAAATETATSAASETATATATSASGAPGILRMRLVADIQNVDPAFAVSSEDYYVAACVLSGLVTYPPDSYTPVNDLADKLEVSTDGLTVSFTLKQGVQWHQGYGEVTADDVKFSYERIADPNAKSPYAGDWATLDHVEVIDKYNGKIILKEAFAPLMHSTLPVGSGKVVCKKYVEQVGNEKFATNPIGSGPYIFSEWKPKESLLLKKNPDYFGKPAAFDEIHYTPIEDDKTAEVAVEAGELDWSMISLPSVPRFQSNPSFKVEKRQGLNYNWIGMNIEHPKLKDINVRQAIRYAIDVPSILQAAYQGQVEQAYAVVAPGLLGYWKDAPKYQRDVAKAKDFLAKAGVQSLDLEMDIQDTTEWRAYAEVAQQNLADIGINITINAMDSGAFWSSGTEANASKLQLFAAGYVMNPDPSWGPAWFTCDEINVWNWMRWCSKEFDDLNKKGLTTLDDTQREQIYIQMQQLWDENCNAIWVVYQTAAYAYAPTIKPALTPNGTYLPTFFEPA